MGKYHLQKMEKIEALLRFMGFSTLAMASVLMATDKQTIMLFEVYAKKATYNCSKIYVISVYLYTIGAGYNLAQLARSLISLAKGSQINNLTRSLHFLKWVTFLADQVTVYIIFAVSCAALQFSMFAVTGQDEFEWPKLCNRFKRFCFQIGGSIVCGILATIILALMSVVSTFNLFRWYSPGLLCLKPKKIGIAATSS